MENAMGYLKRAFSGSSSLVSILCLVSSAVWKNKASSESSEEGQLLSNKEDIFTVIEKEDSLTKEIVVGDTVYTVELVPFFDDQGNIVAIMEKATDVTTYARDHLTGLFNRRYAEIRLAEEYARSKRYHIPFSVVMADIDYFKKINDEKGHAAGDAVLQKVAALIRDNVRPSDIVVRYGGEEFLMILPGTTAAHASGFVERIRKLIEKFAFSGIEKNVTVSFGVAEFDTKLTVDGIIKKADDALYVSKKGGRNKVTTAE